jgi:hypothetical protein
MVSYGIDIFVGLLLVATMAVATTGTISAVFADKDGSQQCSGGIIDKNCQNAIDNYKKHKERVDEFGGHFGDGNPNNDDGQERTLENLEDKQP